MKSCNSKFKESEKISEHKIVSRYRPEVKVGNWVEDLYRQDEDNSIWQAKERNEELYSQRVEKVCKNLLQPINITGPSFEVKHNDTVQLFVPGLRPATGEDFLNEILALSMNVPGDKINLYQTLYEGVQFTVANSEEPVLRNCFKIVPVEKKKSSFLKYNEEFYLQTCEDTTLLLCPQPIVVESLAEKSNEGLKLCLSRQNLVTPGNASAKQNTVPCENFPSIPLNCCRWKIVHIYPDFRYFTAGHPVPTNKQLNIIHSFTNLYLTVTKNTVTTMFGNELEPRVIKYFKSRRTPVVNERSAWMVCTKIKPNKI